MTSYREMAMEILVFIVAWFAIGFGISTLIGAAASLGASTKPVTGLSEIALGGVTGANAHFDATKVIGGRRMRRKPAACYLLLADGLNT